jgi:hypothetical protein
MGGGNGISSRHNNRRNFIFMNVFPSHKMEKRKKENEKIPCGQRR